MQTTKLVFIRHGESKWNQENKFTGWTDIELSDKGHKEAISAGLLLKKEKFTFDYAYTSVLKRAIHTLWNILNQIEQQWLPVEKSWRLNERHYGLLQGLNKVETAAKYGAHQVKLWRRSFEFAPPALTRDDPRYPGHDPRYSNLKRSKIPVTESLASNIKRVVPYWERVIKPRIKNREKIIIVAHGNSLRALIKHIDNINKEKIIELNIPTAIPLVYEFDQNIKPVNNYYLGDPSEVAAKITIIANQCKENNLNRIK